MTRSKKAEQPQDVDNATHPQESQAESLAAEAPAASESPEASKSKWVSQFGSWGDYEAGVHLGEDRKNGRMTIKFEDKPSEAVRAVLKDKAHGYRFDSEDKVWYKQISRAKPRQSREEADRLVSTVANLIRQEKGLPLKESFGISM